MTTTRSRSPTTANSGWAPGCSRATSPAASGSRRRARCRLLLRQRLRALRSAPALRRRQGVGLRPRARRVRYPRVRQRQDRLREDIDGGAPRRAGCSSRQPGRSIGRTVTNSGCGAAWPRSSLSAQSRWMRLSSSDSVQAHRPNRSSTPSRPSDGVALAQRPPAPPGSAGRSTTTRTPWTAPARGEHDATVERDRLAGDAEVPRRTRPCCSSCGMTQLRGVDRDREADRLRAADDRGVDADHLAARVQQRPARVARVERRVGLDHVRDQPAGAGAHAASERADDARGDGVLEAERVADRDRDLAALERVERPSASGASERPRRRRRAAARGRCRDRRRPTRACRLAAVAEDDGIAQARRRPGAAGRPARTTCELVSR